MSKKNKTVFETVASYVDKTSPRSYATCVLADGQRIAATDGFGLIATKHTQAPGSYRPSGELTQVKPPAFACILDQAPTEKGRDIEPWEGVMELLAGARPGAKTFLGIGKEHAQAAIVTSAPLEASFPDRVWINVGLAKKWLTGCTALRLGDYKVCGTSTIGSDEFTHLLIGVTPDRRDYAERKKA